MAKKRRKEEVEEEKYEFVPPDFDEKSFLEKDLRGTDTLLVTAGLAVVFGILAYLAGTASAILGLVVLIAGIVLLRYFYRIIKVGPKEVEFRMLAGNIVLFFLLGLGIWILLMNPPFSDHVAPQVSDVKIAPITTHVGVPMVLSANITDNGGISTVQVRIYLSSGPPTELQNMTHNDSVYPNVYQYTATLNTAGDYLYDIAVKDTAGLVTEKTGTFQVVP
jgi:hypothetical protein